MDGNYNTQGDTYSLISWELFMQWRLPASSWRAYVRIQIPVTRHDSGIVELAKPKMLPVIDTQNRGYALVEHM
ncbi:hypothetical protein BC628DRAFT_1394066 [Trametes gibbosa]|nr:hypothetical protein BC628DRAFT_1394066 [Trametes gibbosa]